MVHRSWSASRWVVTFSWVATIWMPPWLTTSWRKPSDKTSTQAFVPVQSVRHERDLLGDNAPEEVIVSLQKRGSRLIGGTQSIPLSKAEVTSSWWTDSFPKPDLAMYQKEKRAGLTTLGLPYATDPAIPRHAHSYDATRGAKEVGATIEDGLPAPTSCFSTAAPAAGFG